MGPDTSRERSGVLSRRVKQINAAIREVRKEFDSKCVICKEKSNAGCHILSRGGFAEFAAVIVNIVILCGGHHTSMDSRPSRQRLGWLLKMVCEQNFKQCGVIGARLVRLCEVYTELRGGVLEIE